jgi:catechol 2,3-dioxygenase-like lactoylglutathione lyase family enzyme
MIEMHNIGIVVEDIEAAKAFFAELGLELEGEVLMEEPGAGRLVGLDDIRCDIAMMRVPGGPGRLELMRFRTPAAVRAEPADAPSHALGLRRILFVVKDIESVVERLRPHGAELMGELTKVGNGSHWMCYLRGPSGIIVALTEPVG